MPETIAVRGEGLTLELLLHRKYGVPGRALLREAYELNPGLAGMGTILPLGVEVVMPDLPPERPQAKTLITVFGVAHGLD